MAEVEKLDKALGTSGGVKFSEYALAGITKPFVEAIGSKFVGNGTIQSGAVKLAGAYFIGKKIPTFLKIALIIDGVEDILADTGLLQSIRGFSGVSNQNENMVLI